MMLSLLRGEALSCGLAPRMPKRRLERRFCFSRCSSVTVLDSDAPSPIVSPWSFGSNVELRRSRLRESLSPISLNRPEFRLDLPSSTGGGGPTPGS
jgi:hypothetical protein